MKYTVAVLCFTAACGWTLPSPSEPEPDNVAVVTALRHTVFMPIGEGGCTAVDIGGGRIVTAKHCVDDLELGAETSVGRLAFMAPDRDWALLMSQDYIKHAAPVLRAPYLGEHVYAVGFPVQLATSKQELTVTDGVVCGPSDDVGSLRFTAPIFFGKPPISRPAAIATSVVTYR